MLLQILFVDLLEGGAKRKGVGLMLQLDESIEKDKLDCMDVLVLSVSKRKDVCLLLGA